MTSLLNLRQNALAPVHDEFNRLFDSFFTNDHLNAVKSRFKAGFPRMDLIETDEKWIAEMTVPGVTSPEDLTVEVTRDNDDYSMLRVSGHMNSSYQYGQEAKFHTKELRRSHFSRSMPLPSDLHGEPDAILSDGILRLIWSKPKAVRKNQENVKRIEVKVPK